MFSFRQLMDYAIQRAPEMAPNVLVEIDDLLVPIDCVNGDTVNGDSVNDDIQYLEELLDNPLFIGSRHTIRRHIDRLHRRIKHCWTVGRMNIDMLDLRPEHYFLLRVGVLTGNPSLLEEVATVALRTYLHRSRFSRDARHGMYNDLVGYVKQMDLKLGFNVVDLAYALAGLVTPKSWAVLRAYSRLLGFQTKVKQRQGFFIHDDEFLISIVNSFPRDERPIVAFEMALYEAEFVRRNLDKPWVVPLLSRLTGGTSNYYLHVFPFSPAVLPPAAAHILYNETGSKFQRILASTGISYLPELGIDYPSFRPFTLQRWLQATIGRDNWTVVKKSKIDDWNYHLVICIADGYYVSKSTGPQRFCELAARLPTNFIGQLARIVNDPDSWELSDKFDYNRLLRQFKWLAFM